LCSGVLVLLVPLDAAGWEQQLQASLLLLFACC
jgi:hypothetical protein